jgi:hypothetical protein
MEQCLPFNQKFPRMVKKVDLEQQGTFHCWQDWSWWETAGYTLKRNFCRGNQYSAVHVCKLKVYIVEISLVVIWSCWSVERTVSCMSCTEDSPLSVGVSHPKKVHCCTSSHMRCATTVCGNSNHCMYCVLLWKLGSETASFFMFNTLPLGRAEMCDCSPMRCWRVTHFCVFIYFVLHMLLASDLAHLSLQVYCQLDTGCWVSSYKQTDQSGPPIYRTGRQSVKNA